ncbi:hypothetical protein ANO11243_011420 [Dothideomycetidae sp. 11243]|nr:hypothetical protein ANO11243_011420 [fungal sp. No.11243]
MEDDRPTKVRKLSHTAAETGPFSTDNASPPATTTAPPPLTTSTPITTPSVTSTSKVSAPNPLSKNQLKKARRAAEWESQRSARAAQRKEKNAAKRERQRAQRDAELAAKGQTIADYARERGLARPRPTQLPVTFLIDCGYDGLMRDGERVSLAAQITRAYGENRRAVWRGHVALSSFGGGLKGRFEGVLNGGYRAWKGFRVFDEGFAHVAPLAEEWMRGAEGGELKGPFEDVSAEQKGEVVYLSSESSETLHELKPYSTYIVGGLVDKNREKGVCHRAACESGIRTARLPIGEYLEMQSRKVLATNHVVEIMLKWLEYRNWGKAFLEVIPKRKGGALKGDSERGDEVENGDEGAGEDEEGDDDTNGADENAMTAENDDKMEMSTNIEPAHANGPTRESEDSVKE